MKTNRDTSMNMKVNIIMNMNKIINHEHDLEHEHKQIHLNVHEYDQVVDKHMDTDTGTLRNGQKPKELKWLRI
jgi:hypothetical protein